MFAVMCGGGSMIPRASFSSKEWGKRVGPQSITDITLLF